MIASRSSPPIHLPLIFSAPPSARVFHLSSSCLAAGRSGLVGLLSTNCCQSVTAASPVSTVAALERVAANESTGARGPTGAPPAGDLPPTEGAPAGGAVPDPFS